MALRHTTEIANAVVLQISKQATLDRPRDSLFLAIIERAVLDLFDYLPKGPQAAMPVARFFKSGPYVALCEAVGLDPVWAREQVEHAIEFYNRESSRPTSRG